VSDKPRAIQRITVDFNRIVLTDAIRMAAYETLLAVDEQLRVILEDLVRLGIDDNTVVILTSDNGVGWGEHRFFVQSKQCPYEECLRVPMIVRDPRRGDTAIVRDAPVLNLDVAPTVAELAGVTPPVSLDGMSFVPWLGGNPPAQWREDFLIENIRPVTSDMLDYTGQVSDGDQIRFLYGDWRAEPRTSVLLEFDNGGGVTAGAVAVPIGADPDATFASLAAKVESVVPFAQGVTIPDNNRVIFVSNSPAHYGIYVIVERDQRGVIVHQYGTANFAGVRDTTSGFTYVEHESGEQELYDLTADPAELESKASDAGYAQTRARLAERLKELLR
jgi:hypothetical protein